jgi:hypothetical protein
MMFPWIAVGLWCFPLVGGRNGGRRDAPFDVSPLGGLTASPGRSGAARERLASWASAMDQELVNLLQCTDKASVEKGAGMLAAVLADASFPSKSVQALREVPPSPRRGTAPPPSAPPRPVH